MIWCGTCMIVESTVHVLGRYIGRGRVIVVRAATGWEIGERSVTYYTYHEWGIEWLMSRYFGCHCGQNLSSIDTPRDVMLTSETQWRIERLVVYYYLQYRNKRASKSKESIYLQMIPYRHLPGCLLGRCNNFPIHPSIHCIEQVLASGRRVSIPKLLFVIDSSSSSLIKTSLGSIGQYLNSLLPCCSFSYTGSWPPSSSTIPFSNPIISRSFKLSHYSRSGT